MICAAVIPLQQIDIWLSPFISSHEAQRQRRERVFESDNHIYQRAHVRVRLSIILEERDYEVITEYNNISNSTTYTYRQDNCRE